MYILSILVLTFVRTVCFGSNVSEFGAFDRVNPLWSGCKCLQVSMSEYWVVISFNSVFPVLPDVICPPIWSKWGLEIILKSPISMILSVSGIV